MSLTMEIKSSLERGEYNDPVQVRKLLKSGTFSTIEFCDSLWAAVLSAFPCPMEGAIPHSLTSAKQKLWRQMCDEEPGLNEHERIFRKCRNSNLCMQCGCKKEIIDFFVRIGSGSADTVRHRLASWLSGRVCRLDRLTYIQLCFAMNMRVFPSSRQPSDDEKQHDANRFLTLFCSQPPLYTIRPDEAVYYYCLANPEGRSNSENWIYACNLIKKATQKITSEADEDVYTMQASSVIENIRTEGELLDFISRYCLEEHELYSTARENCRLLFEQFDISETIAQSVGEELRLTGKIKKNRNILKKTALKILDALSDYDGTGRIDGEILELLEKHSFGDILYSSDRLEAFLCGEEKPDRTLLLLTLLAQNCGMKYDPETNTLEESSDLTDLPSFGEYFGSLSSLMKNMCMAPIYPRRRIDFIVLYAYHLLQKDFLGDKEVGALSEYIVRALKITMEGSNNA